MKYLGILFIMILLFACDTIERKNTNSPIDRRGDLDSAQIVSDSLGILSVVDSTEQNSSVEQM